MERKDGEVRCIVVREGLTMDANGRVNKVAGVGQDATGRLGGGDEVSGYLPYIGRLGHGPPCPAVRCMFYQLVRPRLM